LQYFIENGNNIFIFIHGFNVTYDGAHEWLSSVEKNLNTAAGFTDDYHQYTRIVLFTWEGNPTLRADYYSAMNQSFQDSEKLAYLIQDLRQRAPQLKINLMAHSLGNSLIVHALDSLAKRFPAVISNVFLWQAAIPRNVLNTHSMTQAGNPWHLPYAHAGAKRWSILFSGNDCLLGPIRGEKLFSLSQSRINQYKPFDELLLGCFCKYLDLNCLYSAAVQLGLSVSQLLESQELDRAYLAWRMQHPERLHDAHGRPLQPTLSEQASLPDASVSNAGFIIKIDIKLYFAMVRIYAVLAKLGLVNMGKLRENITTIIVLGATNMLNPAVMILECLGELFQRDAKSFMKHFQALRGSQSFIQLCDWYGRALTFVHLLTETTMTTPESAMGYAGLDAYDPRIQEFDLTEVIYAHSDMKNPRPAIQDRAYRDIIIRTLQRSSGFGNYPRSIERQF